MIYAVGFIGNRVYAIYQDGDIKVLPYSKEEYLTNKHRYDESIRLHKMILRESKFNNIIKETLHKYIYKKEHKERLCGFVDLYEIINLV